MFKEVEVSLNRRTEAIASMACKAWGPDLAVKHLAEVAQRCLDAGKGPGIIVQEMELAASRKIQRDEANAARRLAIAANPAVGVSPEVVLRGQITRLNDYGWRAIRRVMRAQDLHHRPKIRPNVLYQKQLLGLLDSSGTPREAATA